MQRLIVDLYLKMNDSRILRPYRYGKPCPDAPCSPRRKNFKVVSRHDSDIMCPKCG